MTTLTVPHFSNDMRNEAQAEGHHLPQGLGIAIATLISILLWAAPLHALNLI